MKPNLQKLWNAFPTHAKYPSLKDFYTMLGGAVAKNVNVPGFGPNGNTCASRLSVAFNNGGAKITVSNAKAARAETMTASDGSLILFRVFEFRNYLLHTLGKPMIDNVSPYDDSFRGKRGIIAFTVNWRDASGHIALWNGAHYREPAHDDYSTYVNSTYPGIHASRGEFWELI